MDLYLSGKAKKINQSMDAKYTTTIVTFCK